ncbi:unnamed protein product [Timema podura]|uniref:Uncharacterized protein n=1 Tax=Timema podura TaxID=61482 RepID=A0ABN7PBR1_TIMPD|nr:unnamed protein product [Timema podura]
MQQKMKQLSFVVKRLVNPSLRSNGYVMEFLLKKLPQTHGAKSLQTVLSLKGWIRRTQLTMVAMPPIALVMSTKMCM